MLTASVYTKSTVCILKLFNQDGVPNISTEKLTKKKLTKLQKFTVTYY